MAKDQGTHSTPSGHCPLPTSFCACPVSQMRHSSGLSAPSWARPPGTQRPASRACLPAACMRVQGNAHIPHEAQATPLGPSHTLTHTHSHPHTHSHTLTPTHTRSHKHTPANTFLHSSVQKFSKSLLDSNHVSDAISHKLPCPLGQYLLVAHQAYRACSVHSTACAALHTTHRKPMPTKQWP